MNKGRQTNGMLYFFSALLFVVLTTGNWSCGSGTEPAFFVDLDREFDIPVGLNTIETHIFQLRNVPNFLESGLIGAGVSREEITSIGPADARIVSAFGAIDWSFVSWVEIYAISRQDQSLRQRIFYIDSPDFNNRNEVLLFNTFADMKEIFEEDTFDLEVRLRFRTFVPTNIPARIEFNYAVFNQE